MQTVKRIASLFLALCLPLGNAMAERQLVLSFVGDCTIGNEERLMGNEVGFAQVAEREGYAYFFEKVRPLFVADDLTIANFEGVLKADWHQKIHKTYNFRGLPEYTQILTLGGVDVVSLANNHIGDYGNTGIRTTKEALAAGGVAYFGNTDTYLLEKNGLKIGVIGFYAAGFFAKRKMMTEAVQSLLDQGANAIVCMVHAGQEYATYHSRNQELIARLLVDAGADIVVGAHPHVLQGVEVYQSRTILYSVGNFVFGGNVTVRSLETVVAQATLTFSDSGEYMGQQIRLYPANISGDPQQNNYQPVLVSGEAAQAVYARIDRDSEGQPSHETQTDEYRQYAYLPAAAPEVQP